MDVITHPPQILSVHYNDVIMASRASQITSFAIVYSAVYSGADQRKYQSSASLAFVRGIHRGPVNSPHKWPVTRKMFPFDNVIIFPVVSGVLRCSVGGHFKYPGGPTWEWPYNSYYCLGGRYWRSHTPTLSTVSLLRWWSPLCMLNMRHWRASSRSY